MPTEVTRRGFLAASSAGAAALAAPTFAAATVSPNNRLRLGFIGVGGRAQSHVESAIRLQNSSGKVECAAVCDVYNRHRDGTAAKIEGRTGKAVVKSGDYRDLVNDPSIDAVVISTPDHWHARQTIDALKAGKHVYCEKPMTHTVEEALEVHQAWKASGLVMQVGVQSTAMSVWRTINEHIREGKLGKVVQYQTEYYRNSAMGQWRYYGLDREMTPKNIDWDTFLGHELGLAPKQPFDRARFAQWRCYWDFGSGLYTDLFVHRTTAMLTATGVRFPGRVVGGGGIFLEYDGREAPDVATVVADFPEGVQGLATATMCNANTAIKQIVRGHHGSAVLRGSGEKFSGYEFVAERPQVTLDSSIKDESYTIDAPKSTSMTHFENFADAAIAGDPAAVNCDPELSAAAMVIVKLGVKSYRTGKVYHFDRDAMRVVPGDETWARQWEELSYAGGPARHVPGWRGGDKGSVLFPKEYQTLAGPWVDGQDPAGV